MVISLVTTPIYVGELASASIRGSLVLMAELTYAVGLLLAYVVGWLTDYYALATVCATVPMVTGVLMFFVPESPYYLMLAGKPAEAAASLRRLRDSDEAAFARELETVRLSATEEKCDNNIYVMTPCNLITKEPFFAVVSSWKEGSGG